MGVPEPQKSLRIVPKAAKLPANRVKLTPKQEHVIDLLCAGMSQALAAKRVGVNKGTITHWLHNPLFQAGFRDAKTKWKDDIAAQCDAEADLTLLDAMKRGGNQGVKAAIYWKKSRPQAEKPKVAQKITVTFGKPLEDLREELESKYEIKPEGGECSSPTPPTLK